MAVSTQRYIDQDFCLASPATPATPPRRGGENILRGLSACRKTNDPRGKTARTKAENGRFVASTADRLRNGRSTRKRPRSSSPLPPPHPRVFDTRAPRLSHATLLSMGSLFLGRARIDAPCLWNSGRRKQTRRRDMASTWNKDTRDFVFYTGQLCRPGVLSTRNYRGK